MWIRDRGDIGHRGADAQRAGHRRHVDDAALRGLEVRRTGCLLYTSDAADERSSVDLGGRRIIKKKTHTTIADESSQTP